jgi:hypothetical protein
MYKHTYTSTTHKHIPTHHTHIMCTHTPQQAEGQRSAQEHTKTPGSRGERRGLKERVEHARRGGPLTRRREGSTAMREREVLLRRCCWGCSVCWSGWVCGFCCWVLLGMEFPNEITKVMFLEDYLGIVFNRILKTVTPIINIWGCWKNVPVMLSEGDTIENCFNDYCIFLWFSCLQTRFWKRFLQEQEGVSTWLRIW